MLYVLGGKIKSVGKNVLTDCFQCFFWSWNSFEEEKKRLSALPH